MATPSATLDTRNADSSDTLVAQFRDVMGKTATSLDEALVDSLVDVLEAAGGGAISEQDADVLLRQLLGTWVNVYVNSMVLDAITPYRRRTHSHRGSPYQAWVPVVRRRAFCGR